jgi:hypothetical protein
LVKPVDGKHAPAAVGTACITAGQI